MINRFALSFLCIELDRDEMYGVALLYILLRPVRNNPRRGGGGSKWKWKWKMHSADVCNRASIISAWGLGPLFGPQKLNAFKVCFVHSKPLLELNSLTAPAATDRSFAAGSIVRVTRHIPTRDRVT